jgi:hypothetical protein
VSSEHRRRSGGAIGKKGENEVDSLEKSKEVLPFSWMVNLTHSAVKAFVLAADRAQRNSSHKEMEYCMYRASRQMTREPCGDPLVGSAWILVGHGLSLTMALTSGTREDTHESDRNQTRVCSVMTLLRVTSPRDIIPS